MAFCSNCGAPLLDGARFCSSCGALTDSTEQVTSQPVQQPAWQEQQVPGSSLQPQVQGSFVQTQPYVDPKYQKLGGWLLFFVICWGLAALFGLYNVFSTLSTIVQYGRFFGAIQFLSLFVSGLSSVFSIAVDVFIMLSIIKKNPKFLRLYQILVVANSAFGLLSILISGAATGFYNAPIVIGTFIGVIIGCAVGLILMTMYFCKSVRVRTYMGSTEYLDSALFKIGV